MPDAVFEHPRLVSVYDALDPDRSLDVYFHELMADPKGVVGAIYAKADLELNAQAQADLDHALESKPRGRHGQLAYDLRGDFGIEPGAIRERFDFYTIQSFPGLDGTDGRDAHAGAVHRT